MVPQRSLAPVVAAIVAVGVAMMYVRRKKPVVVRAALDIGSGEHKLVIASMTEGGGILRVLHSEVVTVLLAMDLKRPGGDGSLSPEMLDASSAGDCTSAPSLQFASG